MLHHLVVWTADFLSSWWQWIDWDFLAVLDPLFLLESVPVAVFILVSITIIMPVATVPFPSAGCKAVLGWTPVVPAAIVVLVPDLLVSIPLPKILWSSVRLAAPVADLWVVLVLFDEVHALLLSRKDLLILSINLVLRLAEVILVIAFDVCSRRRFQLWSTTLWKRFWFGELNLWFFDCLRFRF